MSTDINTKTESCYNSSTRIWSGDKGSLQYPGNISVGSVLLECLLKNPEKINQICCDSGEYYSNREIAEKVISVSIHFKKLGYKQGDVVGICATNSDFLCPLVVGALTNGLIINSLDTILSKDGIKHMYAITTPSIVFCDGFVYDRVKESCAEIGLKAVIYTLADHLEGVPNIGEFLTETFIAEDFRPDPLKDDSNQTTALIMCSSGTTGLSKGVSVTHAALLSLTSNNFYNEKDRIFCFSSFYWASGICFLVLGIHNGSPRLFTRKSFDAELFLDIIEKYKVTVVAIPPRQMSALAASPTIHKRDLSSMKYYLVGGSVVSPAAVAKIQPFIKTSVIIVNYGMSEMPGFAVSGGISSENGNTGKLVKNVELRIINDEGENLGPNESGEILVRSKIPFIGYYRNPEATAESCDNKGWIHSGDIGYMNDNNELFVVDRKKEIFKVTGHQVSPSEIESIIMKIPDVEDVCVTGIPDDIYIFLPAAMIILKTGSCLKENDVVKYVAERMENYKQLRGGVYFVNDLPKTPSGKTIRRKVTEMCIKLRGL